MTGPRASWRRLSLTVRLTAVLALAVVATVAIMGVSAVSYLRENLMTGAKESALLASQAVAGQVASARSLDDFGPAQGPGEFRVVITPREGDFYAVVDADGGWISAYVPSAPSDRAPSSSERDPSASGRELSADQVRRLESIPVLGSRPVAVDVGGLGEFLVTSSPLPDPGGGSWGTLYSGSSLEPTNAAIEDFVRRDVLLYSALGLAIAAVTTVIVLRSLRPLRQIAAVADHVAAAPLAEGEVAIPERAPATDRSSRAEADRLAVSFNRMLENVETSLQVRQQAERSMRRFVAEASHELRNPLAAIRGYAEYTAADGGLPGGARRSLSRIEAEAVRLSGLVDQLLLLARVDAGRTVAAEPVDLTLAVLEIVQDCRMHWGGHDWVVDLPDEPVTVLGTEDTLRRILINLTGNAGSHTPEGTTVRVSISPADGDGNADGDGPAGEGRWTLRVADDGPGIAAEDLPTVFDRFTQASGGRESVRDAGSAGLGLAIVRALAGEAGLEVRADSRPGRTCFSVSNLRGA